MTTSNFALLLLLAFSLLAVSAAARPCKTLFFITSTSYYHYQIRPDSIPQNPSSNFPQFQTFFITTAGDPTRFGLGLSRPSIVFRRSDPILIRRPEPDREDAVEQVVEDGEEFYSSVTNSIRDRTKDIMRVVGALLFGVGCGALTAATMYLIWSLFWPNRFDFDDSDDDFDDGNDNDFHITAKKMGYVAIPTKVVDDDLKKPAPAPAPAPAPSPAKEVV